MADHQLFEAVEEGDYGKVQQLLLNQKVAVPQAPRYQVCSVSLSFLFLFISSSLVMICVCLCLCVVILIWKFWEKKGITPLMRACEKGDLKMITLLIENGAPLHSLAQVFLSFFFCVFFLRREKVWWLIDWLLWFLKDGSDPLIIACEFGNLEIVQFLFEKGSSLHPISVNHLSFFFFSHFQCSTQFLFFFGNRFWQEKRLHYLQFVKKDILKLPNFWSKKELGSTKQRGSLSFFLSFFLSLLISNRSLLIFPFFLSSLLFEQGGESPLWICCERRDFEMANLLIDNKAKMDWSTNVKFWFFSFWMNVWKKNLSFRISFFFARELKLLCVVFVKEGISKWHNFWSTKAQISTFLYQMFFFLPYPFFLLLNFQSFWEKNSFFNIFLSFFW